MDTLLWTQFVYDISQVAHIQLVAVFFKLLFVLYSRNLQLNKINK